MSNDNDKRIECGGCINIKRHRLSKMQRLIIAELQGSYTDKYGLSSRQYFYLANKVAEKYGNHSLMTWQEKEASRRVAYKERYAGIASDSNMPSDERADLLGLLQMTRLYCGQYDTKKHKSLRSNKFCVSFHRSLKNLEDKGYLQRMMFHKGRCIPLEAALQALESLKHPLLGRWWTKPKAQMIELTDTGKALNVNTSWQVGDNE